MVPAGRAASSGRERQGRCQRGMGCQGRGCVCQVLQLRFWYEGGASGRLSEPLAALFFQKLHIEITVVLELALMGLDAQGLHQA